MSAPSPIKYTFLPWIKTGLGGSISNNEKGLKAPRAKIQVELSVRRYNEQNQKIDDRPISKNFFLYGPGDIKGILNSVIIRIEPNANILNFEPNYFPFIEFSQPDFPWRYTPAKPGKGPEEKHPGRLSPWLALIVLEENEFIRSLHPPSEPGLLPKIEIINPEKSLPNLEQCWGWAHTQIIQEISKPESLREILDSEPYKVSSRILCLRKLKPDTHYFAFLVPTFELGRRAGLGILDDDNDVTGTSFAWSIQRTPENHQLQLPVYYQWEFSTSPSGDFESLARKLENRELPVEVGIKKLDVSEAFLSAGSKIGFKKPLFFGGALWSEEAKKYVTTSKKIDLDQYRMVGSESEENPSKEEIKEFIMEMKKLVDLSERLTWSFAKSADFSNECKDPVISPPMYGKWHARKRLVSRISNNFDDPSWIKSLGLDRPQDWLGEFKKDPPYKWLEQINLDPTNRVAAGLGTAVVNNLQEELMASAWDQAGQLLESNKLLSSSEPAREISSNIYQRCIQPLEKNVLITMVRKFHSRVFVIKDDNKQVSVKSLLDNSQIPEAIFSPTFTRINTRCSKIQKKKFGFKHSDSFDVLDRLNKKPSKDTDITNATLDPSEPGPLLTLDYLVDSPILDVLGIKITEDGEDGFQGIKLKRYLQNGQIPERKREMVKRIENSIPNAGASVEKRKGVTVDLDEEDLEEIKEHLKHSLDPQLTIEAKVSKQVERPERLHKETKDKLDIVVAYPEFKRPMFEPLRDLSEELLLPGIKNIAENTIGIVQTNPTFINSYMVGLNHEMARELLWREYTTDQRGSYFRQFWDASAAVERERTSGKNDEEEIIEKYRDIPEIHRWKDSSIEGIHGIAQPENGVLVIRGELLMRYPGTVIYAIKVEKLDIANNNKPILPDTDEKIKEPVFRGTIQPDITFLGFDIKIKDLLGKEGDPGYFFIIQQQPSEPRFGIDNPKDSLGDHPPQTWNDLNWDHVISSLASNNYIDLESAPLNGLEIDNVIWGSHAADLANILLQQPVRIAVHAKELLPNLIPEKDEP